MRLFWFLTQKKRYSSEYLWSRATRIRTWKMTESESVALPFGDSPSLQHSRLYDSTWILSIPFFKKLFSSYSSVTDTLSLIIYRNDFFKHAPVQWKLNICYIGAGSFLHMQEGGMMRSGGCADCRQHSRWKIRQVNMAVASYSLY